MPVTVRSFTSPTLVLLAFDWPQGDGKADFLGFAIERTPGFDSLVLTRVSNHQHTV